MGRGDVNAQAASALERGNAIYRSGRSTLREIKGLGRAKGAERVAELLEDPALPVQRLRVDHLVGAIHRVGASKLSRILIAAGIHPLRYVGPDVNPANGRALTEAQRRRLANEVRRRAA